MNEYIFPVAEIDLLIFTYLSPCKDWKQLMLVNKHYSSFVKNIPLYSEIVDHCKRKNDYEYFVSDHNNSTIRAFELACIMNHFNLVKYLYGKYPHSINLLLYKRKVFKEICIRGNLDIAKWFLNICNLKKFRSDINFTDLFLDVCRNGHFEMTKFLLSIDIIQLIIKIKTYQEAFHICCQNSHLEILKYLISYNKGIDIHENNDRALKTSCENNHLEVVKYLISLDKNINIHMNNEYLFCTSCTNGFLDITKYLISLDNSIDIYINDNDAFVKSCKRGYLETFKYLMFLDSERGKMIGQNELEYLFKKSCRKFRLAVSEYIYSLAGNPDWIRKFSRYGDVFWFSCEIGRFDIAKFLYCLFIEAGIDINYCSSHFLCQCFRNNDVETAKWLCQKSPDQLNMKKIPKYKGDWYIDWLVKNEIIL